MAIPVFLASDAEGARTGVLEDAGEVLAKPGEDEESALRREINELRGQLSDARARVDQVKLETNEKPAARLSDANAKAKARPNGQDRMEELWNELDALVECGALRRRYDKPKALLYFLVDHWMAADLPDRAVGLLSRFELDGSLAKYTIRAIDQLNKKGDKANALHACLLLARSGLKRQDLVSRALQLDPARVLEELSATAALKGEGWKDWDAQRSALLLAAGKSDEALAVIDGMRKDKKMPSWVWEQLVQRNPAAASERLKEEIAATKKAGTRQQLQRQLALALKGKGDRAGALALMKELIDQSFNDSTINTFRKVDPGALRDYLAQRVREKPSAKAWELYGNAMLASKSKREAIAAWWEAFNLSPSSNAARRLLQHEPLAAADRLAEGARRRRDDELIGDVADSLWRLGQKDRATRLWAQALEYDSDDSEWKNKVRKARAGEDPFR